MIRLTKCMIRFFSDMLLSYISKGFSACCESAYKRLKRNRKRL